MLIKSVELNITAFNKSQYPNDKLPQIAVIGRSNVGKSSFINTIINRRNFARVSARPGKTQGINFYLINKSFYLADLPGYGYAKVSKEMKKQWSLNIETYLNTSEYLIGAVMLVDIRHVPTEDDILMVDYLKKREIPFIIIATKSDKLNKQEIQKSLKAIADTLSVDNEKIITFSSLKRFGIDEAHSALDMFLVNSSNIED
ncbi:ribosome biogenesis GTP-binding protein YihA/YsxC [Thermoanaerobacterium sp. RBIITD]|uniref:ribosome biogenesis GTP-binding protein YihA/YsxC n=1 Tax=Thermoanaerobacterium sp. RBIITD TaxID=1550240 RepID=UPI000BB8C409|nr:ribosome biogenesis GTP-binding protein YihA/YsxC [Thermoanaerobacterium sp. RBIITD]SNX52955.1 GTP-binding protein [Thermoanaerobacterium sp. RBIITD]